MIEITLDGITYLIDGETMRIIGMIYIIREEAIIS
jgi:hypothetical protein